MFIKDKCEKPQDAGGCLGNYKRWSYDKQSMTCQEFTWGGCQGNENNFLSERECHLRCKDSGRSRGKIPIILKYFLLYQKFKKITSHTQQHIPYYLQSNQKVTAEERCNMTADYGLCQGSQLRWHFNVATQQCTSFLYSGCGGNANRFESHEACATVCHEAARIPATTPEPYRHTTHRPLVPGFQLTTNPSLWLQNTL